MANRLCRSDGNLGDFFIFLFFPVLKFPEVPQIICVIKNCYFHFQRWGKSSSLLSLPSSSSPSLPVKSVSGRVGMLEFCHICGSVGVWSLVVATVGRPLGKSGTWLCGFQICGGWRSVENLLLASKSMCWQGWVGDRYLCSPFPTSTCVYGGEQLSLSLKAGNLFVW